MKAYINGVEYPTLVDFTITDKAGSKTSSDITVDATGRAVPVSGDIVELMDGADTVFWGVCGIPRSPKYQSGRERKLYLITCGNANSLLGRRIANVAYQNYTVSAIVNRLYALYVSGEGIALGAISDISVTIERYTASNYNLQTALNELADLVGATWYVGSDRKFYFLTVDDFKRFPRVVDATFMLGTDLQHKTTDYSMRTVQYIAGATDTTSPQTETFAYDGEQKTFTTSFPLVREPQIYVNNVQVPAANIGVNGLDDSSESVVWYYSYNSQTITYRGSVLVTGDVVKVIYTGQFPIRVAAYNDTKIAEVAQLTHTSGMIESVYLAASTKTTADAQQLAQSLIQQYETATGEISLWLKSEQLYRLGMELSDTDLLTQVSFDLPQLGITGDYVITERSIAPYECNLTDYARQLKISLKLKDRDLLKTYAQTIAALKRDVSQLTIRGEDTVVQTASQTETQALTEDIATGVGIPAYCTAVITHGCLCIPQGLDGRYYPTQYARLSGGSTGAAMYPTSGGGTSLFAPDDLGQEVYPT